MNRGSPTERIEPGPGRGPTRRAWLAASLTMTFAMATVGATALGAASNAHAAGVVLPSAKSLRDELAAALKTGQPLVVLVSLDGCGFCRQAREQYLGPMREQSGMQVVQVDMQSGAAAQDFKGAALTHAKLIRGWNVAQAPTLLFFGRGGVEVAPRLVGGTTSDYYGAYLDARLDQARSAIKASAGAGAP